MFVNIFTFLLFNFTYFFMNVFPKHIIENNSISSIIVIFFNLIFYLFFFLFLIIVFNNRTPFSEDLFLLNKKNIVRKLILLCLLQFFCEGIIYLLSIFIPQYIVLVQDFIVFTQWIVIYFICVKDKNNLFIKSRRLRFFSVVMFFLVLVISSFVNLYIIRECQLLVSKYDLESIVFANCSRNIDFIVNLKNCFFDLCIGLMFILYHMLFNRSSWKFTPVIKTIIHSSLLICLSFILLFFRLIIYPPLCLSDYSIKKADTIKTKEYDGEFYANTETVTINRINIELSEDIAFQMTKNEIYYNDILLKTFYSNDGQQAFGSKIEGNTIVMTDCFDDYIIDSIEVLIYKNQCICYHNGNNPIVIELKEINKCPENEILTRVCEELILNGNIELLEYSYEYLQKYDTDFVSDYVERLSNGIFLNTEINRLQELGINLSYLVGLFS